MKGVFSLQNIDRSRTKLMNKILLNLVLLAITIFFIWPIYWMVTGSFKNLSVSMQIPPEWIPLTPTIENYAILLEKFPTLRWLFNSALTAVITTVLVLFVSSTSAYALAKVNFRGAKYVFGAMIAAMTLPNTILFIPLFKMMNSWNISDTYAGLILPVLGWPFGVFLLRQFMQTLPTTLIEASRIDGCSELGIYARIILPLAKPGLGALAIFTFVRSWNDYVWQTIVLKSENMLTLPLGIQIAQKVNEVEQNYGVSMAGAALATLPVLIVFISFQKYFTKGIMLGAVKG